MASTAVDDTVPFGDLCITDECVPFRCFALALIDGAVDGIPFAGVPLTFRIDDTLLTKYLLTCMIVAGLVESLDSFCADCCVRLGNRLAKNLLCDCSAKGGHDDTISSFIDAIDSSSMLPAYRLHVDYIAQRTETEREKKPIS